MVLSGAFLHMESGFEDHLPQNEIAVPNVIRLNYNRAQSLFKGGLDDTKTTVDNKWIKNRKKYRRLIDGTDDHEIYAKTIQYASYTERFLRTHYETPFFVTQQHAFLFRLSVF
jgi:hypothetical protein